MNEYPREKAIIAIPGWVPNRMGGFGRTSRGSKLGKTYTASVWVFRCCAAIGNSLSSMPWQLKMGDEILEDNHPAVVKMETMNPEDNFIDVVRDSVADWKLFGYSVWLPKFLGSRLRHIKRLPSSTVELKGTKNNITHIEWTVENEMFEIPRSEIILFKSYGAMDMSKPDSPAKVAIDKARSEQAMDTTVMEYFLHYGVPPYVFESENPISSKEMKKYREWWNEMWEGVKRRFRIGFVGGGMKAKRLQAPISEMAFPDLKAETRTDICGAFGVPPSIVGAKETASKATWKQHMVMFHHNTINPDARYFGGVLNQDLMPLMFDQPKFEFLPEKVEVLQEERTAKSERVVAEVEAGILNRFAAAEILGYEPHQVGEAPMDVTKEFSEKSEKRALRREIKKFMKKNPNLKTFEFRSQILSPDRILEIMEESKNGND